MHAPAPFTLFTITYKVAVDTPAERADTLPLFHLYPYMYSVVPCTHEENIRGGGKTVHVVFKYIFRSLL
jgi:hypothetical protein